LGFGHTDADGRAGFTPGEWKNQWSSSFWLFSGSKIGWPFTKNSWVFCKNILVSPHYFLVQQADKNVLKLTRG